VFGRIGRRIIAALAGLGVLALIVWALWPQPVPVDMAAVGRGPLEVTVEDEGMTRIREVYTVSAPIGGKMLRAPREVGDDVVANKTLVASIEPTDPTFLDVRSRRVAQAAVHAAQAAVDLAEAKIKEANSQLAFARNDLSRAEKLALTKTISARALEKAKLDVDSAEAAVASAVATLEVRRRELESAKAHLIQPGEINAETRSANDLNDVNDIHVYSPVNGRVLKIVAESEQVVQAGAPLLEIGDPKDLEIVIDFLSRDAVRIRPGQPARIESWGGDKVLSARVKRVEPNAFTKVSALGIEEQRVKVILDFTSPSAEWRELGNGYRVVARVVVWHRDDVLEVPLGALFREGDKWAVFVVENGRAQRRLIKIGERNLHAAQVLDGLKAGERVVLHPSDRVYDGVRVEPRD
jgi:HlyD family secretion protein